MPQAMRRGKCRPMDASKLTPGQRAYEEKRARKAGMKLDAWLRDKEKRAVAERAAAETAPVAAAAPKPPGKPGLFSRLMERMNKPL